MNKISVELVEASEIFAGLPSAWQLFINGEPDCSWGNNSRTLVRPTVILDVLDDFEAEDAEVAQAIQRLKQLGDTYVDLEN